VALPLAADSADPTTAASRLRALDRELRAKRGKTQLGPAEPVPGSTQARGSQLSAGQRMGTPGAGAAVAAAEDMPTFVAFADFVPEDVGETQFLKLQVGDEIIAMGQDGEGGWQYGRKLADGSEGWFPPSYVTPK